MITRTLLFRIWEKMFALFIPQSFNLMWHKHNGEIMKAV